MNRLHGRLGTPLASIVADEHVQHVESDTVVGGLTAVAPLTTDAPRVMSRRMLPVDSPLLSPAAKVRTNETTSATPEAAHAAKIASIRKQTEVYFFFEVLLIAISQSFWCTDGSLSASQVARANDLLQQHCSQHID
jgi:hypothetical protein